MTKRLCYTCPIKALYMMKEFGVKFVDEVGYNFEDWRVDRDGINLITDLTRLFTTYPRVYVAKESKKIFDLKDGDMNLKGHLLLGLGGKPVFVGVFGPYEPYDEAHKIIIMRDNKQFFMPEVEND